MPNVTIDGQTIQVPPGTLVVEAAKPVGSHIPVFCYHPKMQSVGMCRMCLVEVGTPKLDPATRQPVLDEQGQVVINWMPKLQTGCTTVVSEGMAVRTLTPLVTEARRSVLEFLLTSHPLDCPVCDKGGECPLQDHTLQYGPGQSRFYVENKFHNDKHVRLSPLIMLDRERCIQCARCVRFQEELVGEPVLGMHDRGRGLEIVTFDEPPFNSNFSGNTIDICPVGALTSRDFRFTARSFELDDHLSICQECSVGCNTLLGERDNLVRRITPRQNEAVNEIWMCDKGRYVHHYGDASSQLSQDPDANAQDQQPAESKRARLLTPMIRPEADLKPVSWFEALTFIANKLRPMVAEGGGKSMAGMAGDRVSNEDLYLFQKLFRQVLESHNLDHHVGWAQWNAGEDLVTDLGAGIGTNLGELGKNTAILVLGADPQNEQPILRLRLARATKQGAQLIVANGRLTKLNESASQSVVYAYGAEAHFVWGIVRALVDAGLHKVERAGGVDAFTAALTLSVADYADKAGVSAETLQAIASAFGSAENGVLLFGREFMFAMQSDPSVEAAVRALVLLSGHFGARNNGVIALYPHSNSTGAVDMGIMPNATFGRQATKTAGFAAKDMGLKSKMLYVMAADPVRDNPNFRNPGFMIVQDLFLTDTALKADVVLPAASWAERDGTFTNTERRVQLFTQALQPVGQAKPDWAIIQEVARHLGARWEYTSAAQVMDEITQQVPQYAKMSYERLRVTARRRNSVLTVEGDSVVPVRFALGELSGMVSGVPWQTTAETEPTRTFDVKYVEPKAPAEGKGPYLAVTRALLDRGSAMQYSLIVQPRVPAPVVEINSHDGEEWGIADGAAVKLTIEGKPVRTINVTAHVNGSVPRGVIALANNLDETTNLPMGVRVQVEKVN